MAIYLKLDGIDGDATHQDHRNWMRIENLDLGIRRRFRTGAGVVTNREGRQPALSPVRLVKRSCRATPLLMTESLAGSRSKTAVIHVVDTGSPGRTYIEVTLSNVLVIPALVLKGYASALDAAASTESLEKVRRKDRANAEKEAGDATKRAGAPPPNLLELGPSPIQKAW